MRNKSLERLQEDSRKWPDARLAIGPLLHKDDFTDSRLADWVVEREGGGTVDLVKGHLNIDVSKGCTAWYRHELTGPLVVEYEAAVIRRSGPNDRVSDLNCFWMAPAAPASFWKSPEAARSPTTIRF